MNTLQKITLVLALAISCAYAYPDGIYTYTLASCIPSTCTNVPCPAPYTAASIVVSGTGVTVVVNSQYNLWLYS